jgi:ATP-dependent exoDNAse (exonuclease V) beta subunit
MPSKIQIYRAKSTEDDGVEFLIDKVRQLYDSGLGKDDILVLYRRSKMFSPYLEALKQNRLFVSSKTIHASKGLEAKAVFIIGLTEGNGGFPDIWLDDAIFRVVKDIKYDILLEEERRLFYVAITRAKDELFLITELGNESSFVDEIPQHFYQVNKPIIKNLGIEIIVCEECRTTVNESDKFCRNCGSKITKNNLGNSDEKKVPNYVETARLINKNAYMPWTNEDDTKLEELYKQGKSNTELSDFFGRNLGAIIARIQKLELEQKYNLN